MLLKQEGLLHKGPEFCQAFKFVIKLQISTLLQQLAESGEESVVLTANVLEGTADHLGSLRGAGFLEDQEQLQKQFLTYCTETRRLSVDVDEVTMPTTSSLGNNSMHSPTQACNPLVSPHLYHRIEPVRPRYDRESSTSDSVFSPNRRKSSASSKSMDEDVAMLSGHDYSDTARSLSESSSAWPEHPSMLSVELNEKGSKYTTNHRSPTCRGSEMSDKIKHVSKSPMTENMESINQITLSSPTEFHYKRHHQHHSSTLPPYPIASPVRTSPHQLAAPSKALQMSSGSSSEDSNYNTKSNMGCVAGALSPDRDVSDMSPVNLVSTSVKAGIVFNPAIGNVSEVGLSPFFMYKVPYPSYGDFGLKPNTSISDTDNNNCYKIKYETAESENKYKTPYAPQEALTSQSDSFVSNENREYQSEEGETYRVHRKSEIKTYHRHGSSGRKQPKSCIERRLSENSQGYEVSPPSSASPFKDQNSLEMSSSKTPDVITQPDLSKGFEEALRVQQTIFHSSLGLLSPLQRTFLPPGRHCYSNRERSQSMSEFQDMTTPEAVPVGRSRFPSSSFAENLDTPLIIDDDMKFDTGSQEGLDLSNKKRKMSADDVYQSTADEQTDNSNVNISNNQNDDQDYEGLGPGQSPHNSAGTREDQSTKKYGKGNFIKVSTGYQCRICCRVIRHMNNTTAHMRIHANIKPYKCQVCNQQFKYEVDRRYHFSKTHVDLFSKMHFPDEKKTG